MAEQTNEFKQYRRKQIAELRPYVAGEVLSERVSVSAPDREAGSPKAGDMIARNPANHDDQWLVVIIYLTHPYGGGEYRVWGNGLSTSHVSGGRIGLKTGGARCGIGRTANPW